MKEITEKSLIHAQKYLNQKDRLLGKFIREYGDCQIKIEKNYFQELVACIVSQQLSAKAAQTIYNRLLSLTDQVIDPPTIQKLTTSALRSIGISNSKSIFILELSNRFDQLEFEAISTAENEKAISFLKSFKGIGDWTAHMFLIFCMARIDVFPIKDIGLRNGMKKIYGLESLDEKKMHQIANKWAPYRSIGTWYAWKAADQV